MPNSSSYDPYSEEREQLRRRRAIAEAITAQAQQPLAPMPQGAIASRRSPLEGMAQLARAYVGAQGMKQADTESKGLAETQRSDAYNAFSDFQRETTPRDAIARSLTEDVAGVHETDAVPAHAPNAEAQRAAAMKYMSRVDPRQAGQMMAQQAMKGPEYKDLGNAIGVFQNGVKIGEIPKGISPDAAERARSAAELHDRPSGSAQLADERARFTHNTVSAGDWLRDQGANQRHAAPSGSARLAADTTRFTHANQSASSLASERGAADRHNTTSANARLGAETTTAGQLSAEAGRRDTADRAARTAAKPTEAQSQQVRGAQNTRDAIGQYREMLSTFKLTDYASPDRRSTIDSAHKNMMLQAKEAYRLGVLSGPDLQVMESIVTSPTSLKGGLMSKAALDAQAKQLDGVMSRMATVAGGTSTGSGPDAAPATAARPRAVNPQTNEAVEFDGMKWVPVSQ